MTTAHQSFLTQFDDARKPLVEAMLQAIDEECPDLTKIFKWNAPSFCDGGKDRLTIMLHKKESVGLILHLDGGTTVQNFQLDICYPVFLPMVIH